MLAAIPTTAPRMVVLLLVVFAPVAIAIGRRYLNPAVFVW
jgi:hypothetical protein